MELGRNCARANQLRLSPAEKVSMCLTRWSGHAEPYMLGYQEAEAVEGSAGLCSDERSHSAVSPVALTGLGVSLSGPSSSVSIRFAGAGCRGSTFGRLSWSAGGEAISEVGSGCAARASEEVEVLASIAVSRVRA